MTSHSFKKAASALLVLLLGLYVSWQSRSYDIGSLEHMGSGFYPFMLGLALLAVGVLLLAIPQTPLKRAAGSQANPAHVRPWLAVIGSLFVFVVLGKYGGLVPATFAMVAVAALGDRSNTLRQVLTLALFATVATVLVFHYGLALQFALFTWG